METPATKAENARRLLVGAIRGESGGVGGALRSVYSGGTSSRGVATGGGAGATRAPAGRRSNSRARSGDQGSAGWMRSAPSYNGG